MANSTAQRRAANRAKQKKYRSTPEGKAKRKVRWRNWYRRNREEICAKRRKKELDTSS